MRDFLIQCFIILGTSISAVSSSGSPPNFTYLNVIVNKSIAENIPVESTVYTLIATDHEADNLTYGKVSQSPIIPDFHLNTKTGELYSPSGIDAEATVTFVFMFDVSDGTSTVQSANLTVSITDINDNKPICPAICNANIPPAIMNDGNTPTTFIINSTGWIIVFNASNFANKTSYYLKIQASDGTFSCNSATVYISVVAGTLVPSSNCTTTVTTTPSNPAKPSIEWWVILLIILIIWLVLNIVVVLFGIYTTYIDCMKCAFDSFLEQPTWRIVILTIACIFVLGWIYILYTACKSKHKIVSDDKNGTIVLFCMNCATATPVNSDRSIPNQPPEHKSISNIPLSEISRTPRPLPSRPLLPKLQTDIDDGKLERNNTLHPIKKPKKKGKKRKKSSAFVEDIK